MTPVLLLALMALQDQTVLPRPPKAPEPPSAYEQLVTRYQQGDCDAAVTEIAGHSARAFVMPFDLALAKVAYRAQDEKLRQVQRKGAIGQTTKAAADDWYHAVDEEVRFLLAAMMLHTEASLRTPDVAEMRAQLGVARTAEKALADAEREFEPHVWNKVKFEMPQDATAGYLTKKDIDRARHDWVVIVTLGYHARSVMAGLDRFIASALYRYPKDPALELCFGVYLERIARFTIVDDSLARDINPFELVQDSRRKLSRALEAYQEAARAPELAAEAHLRIGRIHALQEDPKQAREQLEPLAESGHPPFIKYLALLLLGKVDERDKKPDAAVAKYRAALTLFPTSQAPFIALSRLADERGDLAGARDWLERSFALTTSRRVDPWWLYNAPFMDVRTLVLSQRALIKR
jgi:tetratricopeptide (TPR) repeat protein